MRFWNKDGWRCLRQDLPPLAKHRPDAHYIYIYMHFMRFKWVAGFFENSEEMHFVCRIVPCPKIRFVICLSDVYPNVEMPSPMIFLAAVQ